MRRCGSDTFRGGQSHAHRRGPGRSHKAVTDTLWPGTAVSGGLPIPGGILPMGRVRTDHLFPGGHASDLPGAMVTILRRTGRISVRVSRRRSAGSFRGWQTYRARAEAGWRRAR